ncbi:hypothetical protein HY025_02115 [Candidatus Daviesbacteria bacterium]|nr:hypothetical protein [Candidatus Daviesbacteria bacterium]
MIEIVVPERSREYLKNRFLILTTNFLLAAQLIACQSPSTSPETTHPLTECSKHGIMDSLTLVKQRITPLLSTRIYYPPTHNYPLEGVYTQTIEPHSLIVDPNQTEKLEDKQINLVTGLKKVTEPFPALYADALILSKDDNLSFNNGWYGLVSDVDYDRCHLIQAAWSQQRDGVTHWKATVDGIPVAEG